MGLAAVQPPHSQWRQYRERWIVDRTHITLLQGSMLDTWAFRKLFQVEGVATRRDVRISDRCITTALREWARM